MCIRAVARIYIRAVAFIDVQLHVYTCSGIYIRAVPFVHVQWHVYICSGMYLFSDMYIRAVVHKLSSMRSQKYMKAVYIHVVVNKSILFATALLLSSEVPLEITLPDPGSFTCCHAS